MIQNYFECHVTLLPDNREKVEPIAKKHKFKTSILVGDEVMGDERLLYCTSHDRTFESMKARMEALISELPPPILRKKIEHILLDERYAAPPEA